MMPSENKGIAIFVGNAEAPQNYRGNDYKFRQDSSFLYYWAIDEPYFAAILDLDQGSECLYGNDVDIEDIIWMGPQPSVASKGALIGCPQTAPLAEFEKANQPKPRFRFNSHVNSNDFILISDPGVKSPLKETGETSGAIVPGYMYQVTGNIVTRIYGSMDQVQYTI